MKLSFSLANSKTKPVGTAPPLKAPSAFATADDDAIDAAPTTSDTKDAAANKKLLAQNVNTSRTQKKRMEAEQRVDATVFEYDEVYDRMQEAKAKQKAVKEQETKERKVCYNVSGAVTWLTCCFVATAQVHPGSSSLRGYAEARSPSGRGEDDPA